MTYITAVLPLPSLDHAIAQAQATAYLQCHFCEWWYRLRPDAIALEVDGNFATVRPGWVEVCPACFSETWPGGWLVVYRPREEAPAN